MVERRSPKPDVGVRFPPPLPTKEAAERLFFWYSAGMKSKLEELAHSAVSHKITPGGVIGIVYASGERLIVPFGKYTYEDDAKIVHEKSIYDVASVTKSIPTSSLALQLIDQGQIKLTDKLIDYVPEFANNYRELVTIKHLLTYSLAGYGLGQYKNLSADEIKQAILTRDFDQAPGIVFKYTNIPAYLLGLVIEKVTHKPLDVLAHDSLFAPLNMALTSFDPTTFDQSEIVSTEVDEWRGKVRGVVHDESAYAFYKCGVMVGHAGVFSTASDLLNFLEMLLKDGEYNGTRFFSPSIIHEMETNQLSDIGESCGLGWELNQPRYMGRYCTEHTFGKTGFTGTLVICDRTKKVAYVILTNRIYPKRPADSSAINAFRAAIGEIILGSN